MPHNEGSPDRYVHDQGGGSGGGGNVVITGPLPVPVDDDESQIQLAAILAALIAGIGVTQLTSPWVVSGTVAVTGTQTDALTDTQLRASPVPVSGTVTANQGTTPWVVDGSGVVQPVSALNLDIRDLTFAQDKVDASGSTVSVTNFPATQPVSAVNLDIRDLDPTADAVQIWGTNDGLTWLPIRTDALGGLELGPSVNNIGRVDVLSVPADPFGANADAAVAAGASGSIQAKLRRLTTDIDVIRTSVAAAIPAGTNNIGDVDIASALPAGTNNIGDVDVASIATGTNEIGYVGARQVNGVIKDNSGTDSTVKVAHLDMTTATTTDIVAAVAGKRIRVFEYQIYLNEATSTTVNFARGAGTTRVTGSNSMLMIGGADPRTQNSRAAPTGTFLFETGDGEALRVTSSGATDLTVAIVYSEML